MCACSAGHWRVAQRLLDSQADPNLRNEAGCTALHYHKGADLATHCRACQHGSAPRCAGRDVVAELLVTSGGTPNVRDAYGHSPLSRAVSAGQESVVRILLEAGATADSEDSEGARVLRRCPHPCPSPPPPAGNTPLHIACEEGNERIARMLVEEGARLDKRNRAGKTPPDLAAPRLRSAMQHAAGGRE